MSRRLCVGISLASACALVLGGCLTSIGDLAGGGDDDGGSPGTGGKGGSGALGGTWAGGNGGSGGGGTAGAGSGGTSPGGGGGAGGGGGTGGAPVALHGCTLPPIATGDPALPTPLTDLTFPTVKGTSHVVNAGDDLQKVLDTVKPGDEVVLPAGATFTGNYRLRATAADDWVIIRSSKLSALPAEGKRVALADAANMPTLVAANGDPALSADVGAHHYRIAGVRFLAPPVATLQLVEMGSGSATSVAEQPHHLVFERSLFQGDPKLGVTRGLTMNSGSTAVLDSYFSDIKGEILEADAILTWNGPGPFLIHNNRLESSFHQVRVGGHDPGIAGLHPEDVSICNNHVTRNLAWFSGDPSYDGSAWKFSSPLMVKAVKRLLISGNVIENSWKAVYHSYPLFLSPINPGNFPQASVNDVTITHNIIRKVTGGIWIDQGGNGKPTSGVHRVRLNENLFYDVGVAPLNGTGSFLDILVDIDSLALTHNTVLAGYRYSSIEGGTVIEAFGMRNNLLGPAQYGLIGQSVGEGNPTLEAFMKAYVFDYNVLTGRSCSIYPANNFCPKDLVEVKFVNAAAGDYRLAPDSPYATAASDGGPIGAHVDQVLAATNGVAP